MKITVTSTDRMIDFETISGAAIPARIWEGTTEDGVKIIVAIARVAIRADADQRAIKELQNCNDPQSRDGVSAFPIRYLLD